MTDHESQQISALRETVEGYHEEVRKCTDFIFGVGDKDGAKVRLKMLEQANAQARASKEQGIAWWQVLLCGSLPVVAQVVIELLRHK